MFLEIVTPEAVLFSGEVDSVAVPGINGEFEMLNNHAPVVSLLQAGNIKIQGSINLDENVKDKFTTEGGFTLLNINSGTLELNENKVIILAD